MILLSPCCSLGAVSVKGSGADINVANVVSRLRFVGVGVSSVAVWGGVAWGCAGAVRSMLMGTGIGAAIGSSLC